MQYSSAQNHDCSAYHGNLSRGENIGVFINPECACITIHDFFYSSVTFLWLPMIMQHYTMA